MRREKDLCSLSHITAVFHLLALLLSRLSRKDPVSHVSPRAMRAQWRGNAPASASPHQEKTIYTLVSLTV
jgi:hypothetical protein